METNAFVFTFLFFVFFFLRNLPRVIILYSMAATVPRIAFRIT